MRSHPRPGHPHRRAGPAAPRALTALGLMSLLAGACGEPAAIPGTAIAFDPGGAFWSSPFPGEHRRTPEGRIVLTGLPNPRRNELVAALRRLLERDADGFGTTSTLYFPLEATADPTSLPTLEGSVDPAASVFLVDVDPQSPERGRRHLVKTAPLDDPSPFGTRALAVQPLQGQPLREATLYAGVVTRSVRDRSGVALGVPESTRRLIEGFEVEGLGPAAQASYQAALTALRDLGVDVDQIAGLAAFRTGRPTLGLARRLEAARRDPSPAPLAPFEAREVFDDFCVFETQIEVPVYQQGDPPYLERGGGWTEAGLTRLAASRLVLTVPRSPMPAQGFPATLFVRTGGGGDRPLVDRGPRDRRGGPAREPGTGPALELARAGLAGLSWDGPHGGVRNPTRADEQFLVLNFSNPEALRDNIRQTALEASLVASMLERLSVTATSCPGIGTDTVRFDAERVALMGHSMGGTIAPLSAAVDETFGALVLSGAGGSWIENVIHKESPLPVRPLAEILLGYDFEGRTLDAFDPVLALLQWAGEPADPPVYVRRSESGWPRRATPPHVLMMQGVEDTYILPPIANALSLSAGLDLAGEALEPSLPALLPLVGASARPLPVAGNADGGRATRVVTQHPEDGIEDGHEVVFQTEPPKRQYRCFLRDFATGTIPEVPGSGSSPGAPCR